MSHLLIVEDDYDLAQITKINLMNAGYTIDNAYSGSETKELLSINTYDLILMDVLLPDCTGDQLCRLIREQTLCPVIFMSCLDDSGTIVSALALGGDDYIVKPVNFDELSARIEANIRRCTTQVTEKEKREGPFRRFNSFTIDTLRRRVTRDQKEIGLSVIEYSLLLYMSESPDKLLLYDDLYHHVWDTESLGDIRTVMVHISNLRKKIDPDHAGIIETVRGAGYIFCDI